MGNRLERIKTLIVGENISIKSEELYAELLEAIAEDKFETHVEAIKDMATDGHKYMLETTKDESGFLSLKIFDETTGESASEEEEKAAETPAAPVTPAAEVPAEVKSNEPKEEPKPEAKAEPEAKKIEEVPAPAVAPVSEVPAVKAEDIADLKSQMAKLLEAVSGGNTKIESLKADLDNRFTQYTENLTALKKKTKDLEDAQYVSKQAHPKRDGVERKNHNTRSEVDLWENMFPAELQGAEINRIDI